MNDQTPVLERIATTLEGIHEELRAQNRPGVSFGEAVSLWREAMLRASPPPALVGNAALV